MTHLTQPRKYSPEFVSLVCEVLVEVQKRAEHEINAGICRHIDIILRTRMYNGANDGNNARVQLQSWIDAKMKSWPHHSGDAMYPVPATLPDHTPREMFHNGWCYEKWSTDTEYGRLRWDLLAHLLTAASEMKVR